MELDQKLFQKAFSLISGPPVPSVDLRRYIFLTSLLSGRSMRIVAVRDSGGFQSDCIFLPSLRHLAQQSRALRKYIREGSLEWLDVFYNYRILDACLALGYLESDAGWISVRNEKRIRCKTLFVKWGLAGLLDGDRYAAGEHAVATDPEILEARGEQSEKSVESEARLQTVQEDKKKADEYILTHNFEKVETLEEFQGNWREMDGADQIEEQSDALNELRFNQVIRTEESSSGYLRSEQSLAASEMAGSASGPFLYPEWDFKKRSFRLDHCSVHEQEANGIRGSGQSILAQNRSTLQRLRKDINRLLNRYAPEPRQTDGDDIDLDASVDYLVDRSMGITPTERIYSRRRRNQKEVDLLLLLDCSLSTDAYRNGIRVLDAEKQAAVLFGEALDQSGLEFRCYAFSSRTRHNCEMQKLYDNQNWIHAKDRVASLEPTGYTRIGPAIRHSISIMKNSGARHRWIVLFTDGQPNDFDRYEGLYGKEDVKHAMEEARSAGIGVHVLSFDRGKDLFGAYAESALHLDRLPDLLMDFYSRIHRI